MTSARLVLALVSLGAFARCTPTQPGPAPVPTPTDRFTARIFDCHLPIVAVERESAQPDVTKCLVRGGATACLVDQAAQYNPATVTCLVRDIGANANAAVLAGSTDPNDELAADQARAFIVSHQLGYR